jgi:ribosome maturation factor RimP
MALNLSNDRLGIEKKFYELCQTVVDREGYGLYDLDYKTGQQILRLYIERKDQQRVVIEDCVKIDRAMTDPLNELSWIPEKLNLEVSSPGVYRELRTRQHLESALGKLVSVVITGELDQELNPQHQLKRLKEKKFLGELQEIGEQFLVIVDKKNKPELVFKILFQQIKKVSLNPDLDDLLKPENKIS